MSDINELDSSIKQKAVGDFYELRRKAAVESILGFIQGKSTDLMAYDQVRLKLRPIESARRILEDIPLSKIVGSVNRTTDFSRSFLPRKSSDVYRWANVRVGVETLVGLPPIEAYRVNDLYFILDGHHRVSVARELGADTIQGYVIPVFTRVPLMAGDSPDDLIIKSEYGDFLAQTQIDHFRPDSNLMVSVPGQYPKLREHINVHKYFMGTKNRREVSDKEAAIDWYDEVYLPIIQVIRSRNLLRDFPNRTETDLYLWIMENRAALSGGGFGWEVSAEKVAADLSNRYSQTPRRRIARLANNAVRRLLPDPLEPDPPPGSWRNERQSPHRGDRLFDDILVTVQGGMIGQATVDLAFEIARREEARLTGLHVVSDENMRESPAVKKIQEDFALRCSDSGIYGRTLVEVGKAATLVCQRSAWMDLSVFRLAYPPPRKFNNRLRSGVRQLVRYCISPLLAVPDGKHHLESALLAYGPGPKSEEALYVAAYLAEAWKLKLTVLSVLRDGQPERGTKAQIEHAREYLESNQVEANYIIERNVDPALSVLLNAEFHHAGLIITGSYESSPIREAFFGSTVDRIMRSTRRPLLICR